MNTAIRIQRIGSESLDSALYLLQRFFEEEGFSTPASEMRASLGAMVTGPSSAVFLAWQGAETVGVATVTTSVGIEYGRAAELEDLYVLPAARRSGAASALIDAVRRWCRAQGCTALLVTVTRGGEAAHGLMDFYQRRGFVNTGRVILEHRLRLDE
jgi:aminoglycoside 6'-N-acetyltransferase I